MPSVKKPKEMVADRRNGANLELQPTNPDALEPHPLYFPPPEGLEKDAIHVWEAYFASPISRLYDSIDGNLLIRWIKNVDRYARLIAQADQMPVQYDDRMKASINPLYAMCFKLEDLIFKYEAQLGIGAKSRISLGVALVSGAKSLADMNAELSEDMENDDDYDPRVKVISGNTE